MNEMNEMKLDKINSLASILFAEYQASPVLRQKLRQKRTPTAPTPDTPLTLLRKAREYLRAHGWTRSWGHAGGPSCLMGTIGIVAIGEPRLFWNHRLDPRPLECLRALGFPEAPHGVAWNDRQHDRLSVLNRLDQAIITLEREERRARQTPPESIQPIQFPARIPSSHEFDL